MCFSYCSPKLPSGRNHLWDRIFILWTSIARIGLFGKLSINEIDMAARAQFGVNYGCRLFGSPIDG